MKIEQLRDELEIHRDRIAAVRDELREFIGSANDLLETEERAHEALNSAIDALSELA